jgi:predicted ATPase with chaperone activity
VGWTATLQLFAEGPMTVAHIYKVAFQVSRPIADLADSDAVAKPRVAEALSYRRLTHLP